MKENQECMELHLHSPNTPPWRGAQSKKKSKLINLPLLLPMKDSVVAYFKV